MLLPSEDKDADFHSTLLSLKNAINGSCINYAGRSRRHWWLRIKQIGFASLANESARAAGVFAGAQSVWANGEKGKSDAR